MGETVLTHSGALFVSAEVVVDEPTNDCSYCFSRDWVTLLDTDDVPEDFLNALSELNAGNLLDLGAVLNDLNPEE